MLCQAHLVDTFLQSCYLSAFENVGIIYMIPITPGSLESKDLPPICMMHYLLTQQCSLQ